jgi:hypothetical protein
VPSSLAQVDARIVERGRAVEQHAEAYGLAAFPRPEYEVQVTGMDAINQPLPMASAEFVVDRQPDVDIAPPMDLNTIEFEAAKLRSPLPGLQRFLRQVETRRLQLLTGSAG